MQMVSIEKNFIVFFHLGNLMGTWWEHIGNIGGKKIQNIFTGGTYWVFQILLPLLVPVYYYCTIVRNNWSKWTKKSRFWTGWFCTTSNSRWRRCLNFIVLTLAQLARGVCVCDNVALAIYIKKWFFKKAKEEELYGNSKYFTMPKNIIFKNML
jgi:hypothetical protein